MLFFAPVNNVSLDVNLEWESSGIRGLDLTEGTVPYIRHMTLSFSLGL